jgi:hypothetical protein
MKVLMGINLKKYLIHLAQRLGKKKLAGLQGNIK